MRPNSFSLRPAPIPTSSLRRRLRTRRLLCESLEQRALMAVLQVTNLNDDGVGSLRSAINTANSTSGLDTINFALPAGPQTITLTSGEIQITDGLIIDGPGADRLTISGNNNSRIFNIRELSTFEFSVDINGVTLTGGNADHGGAIRNEFASVFLNNAVVTGNRASGNGGGILTIGEDFGNVEANFTLILNDSRVANNTAGGSGGGIYNDKDHVELRRSTLENNQATLDGGAAYTEGRRNVIGLETFLVYENSRIHNNQAQRNGGGIYSLNDHVEIDNSTVSNNTAAVNGGGVYSTATFDEIRPSTLYTFQAMIRGNRAISGAGGAIYVDSDSFTISSSTVEDNSAPTAGAVYLSNLNRNFIFARLESSTVNNNLATTGRAGGIYVEGTPEGFDGGLQFSAFNSTISGNSAATQGGGFYVNPTQIFNDFFEFTANTIVNNSANAGGGVFFTGNGVVFENNLIARNTAPTAPDVSGVVTANNNFERVSRRNLVGNGVGSDWTSSGLNLIGTPAAPIDPLIGPLQNNGGATKTHALLVGSPAIDASDSFVFDDQRGARRRNGADLVDIGAYERAFDFGDAPLSYPTTLAANGARHVYSALYLGASLDTDGDGRPSPASFASGDDQEFFDDEDGVVFNFSSTAGFSGSARVTSTGSGVINAWLDVNGNGSWEANERILSDAPVVAGANLLTFNLPAPPANAPTFFNAIARFRLSTATGLQPTGLAEDGEVEDYAMTISNVLLPLPGGGVASGFTFVERVQPRVRRPYDPEIAYGYNYSVNPGGDKFTEAELLPNFGDDQFTIHLFNTTTGQYESTPLATVTAPAIVNFETGRIEDANGVRLNAFTGIAGGVDKFRLLGIELSENLDPNNPAAFPIFLAFGDADGNGTAEVNFTMTPLATPVANADSYSTLEDSLLSTGGLLLNDTDSNNDALTAFLFSNPINGTVTVNPDGSFIYTPNANFNGNDTFTYRAFDGLQFSDPVSVTIAVAPVNDAPTFVSGPNTSALEDAGPQSVTGWATSILAGPANELGQTLNFEVTNDNNALFSVQPAIAADGTLTYTSAPDLFGTATVVVQLKDNGGVANGGQDTSAAQTFLISITSVNDAPSFTAGPNQTVLEDSGARSVPGWATGVSAGPPNESTQTLSFTTTNDNNSLFAVQPFVDSSGTLTYTPASNANGSATVTVTLSDNGGNAFLGVDRVVKTMTITVTPVNDAPSFTKGANLTVVASAGAQTVPGWATAISAGPTNESGQTLSFTATNNNNTLFSVQPAIAPDGTLTFTPAASGNGTATVTVLLSDNGGTSDGGIDTSVAQTFTITVTPPTTTGTRPTASVAGPASAVRGQSVAFTLSANDPDPGDNAAGFTFTINWGDGSPVQTLPAGTASGAVVNRAFTTNGRYTVSVTARDRTGLVSTTATTIVNVSTILLQGGVLVIGGGTTNDSIKVFNLFGTRAVVNNVFFGPYSGVTRVQVFGQSGNDNIAIDSSISVPATVDGGVGDDWISGGSGPDTLLGREGRDQIDGGRGNDFIDGGADNDKLTGGDGNDIILGGAGDDLLYGCGGRDLLIGGLGRDSLYGGGDDDILIGGTTSHDTNRAALDAIMLEWSRTTASYSTRIARLRDGASGGLNGSTRLNGTTVQNDSQVDTLFGESGSDWFFVSPNLLTGDRLRDRGSSETATNL